LSPEFRLDRVRVPAGTQRRLAAFVYVGEQAMLGGQPEYLLAAPRRQNRPHRRNDQRRDRRARTGKRNHARRGNHPRATNAHNHRNRENAPPTVFFTAGRGPLGKPRSPPGGASADSERGLAAAGGDPATVKRQGGFSAERARVASEPARPVRAGAADRGGVGPAAGGSKAPHPLICVGVLRGSRSQGAAVTLRFEGQRLVV
jgi:hypothetical protein